MARKPEIKIEVAINRAKNVIAITHAVDGNPVASCDFTPEQAAQHIRHVQTGIDMLLGRGHGGIIIPDDVKVQ